MLNKIDYVESVLPEKPPLPGRADSGKELMPMRLTPSAYLKDKRLELPKKLAKTARHPEKIKIQDIYSSDSATTKPFTVPLDSPLFEPYPSAVHFQNFQPFKAYEVVINFRNNDKFARSIRVLPIDNPNFSISAPKLNNLQSTRLATGMEAQFVLKFTPSDYKDYSFDIECMTEREKFLLPVRAFGPRGILDIPDIISFENAAVNFKSTKTILIRNIGDAPAKFTMEAKVPFALSPVDGFLKPKESMQVTLEFFPEQSSVFNDELIVRYDTGETTSTLIQASTLPANISLSNNEIAFGNHFITTSAAHKIQLLNHSDLMVRYRWKRFDSKDSEQEYKARCKLDIEEKHAALVLTEQDPTVANQKFKNDLRQLEEDKLHPTLTDFGIEPLSGVVWPHSSVEISMIYCPKNATSHEATIYCEVDGLEKRLPLRLEGSGIGPRVKLFKYTVDVQDVFVGTVQEGELRMENRGDIDAPFEFINSHDKGSQMNFEPSCGILPAGQKINVGYTFSPKIVGDFEFRYQLVVTGSPKGTFFVCKGRSKGPEYSLSTKEIDFENISFGFPTEKTFNISNKCEIPMPFKFRFDEFANGEYKIVPNSGVIDAFTESQFRIICTPKNLGNCSSFMYLDIDHLIEASSRVELNRTSATPEIFVDNQAIVYENCFIGLPYHKTVHIHNKSNLHGILEVIPLEPPIGFDESDFKYKVHMTSTTIDPKSDLVLDLRFIVEKLGQFDFPLQISVKGNEANPIILDLSVHGTGPVVTSYIEKLDFGKVAVLQDHQQSLKLKNPCPIPAKMICYFGPNGSVFKCSVEEAVLAPEEEIEIQVYAFLNDSVKFNSILFIEIQNGELLVDIEISAQGQGTTIIMDEDIKQIDFGDVFSSTDCKKHVLFTNKGRRTQTISWMNTEKSSKKAIFYVQPSRFVLKPEAQQLITIIGRTDQTVKCNETLICHTSVDKDSSRKTVVESHVCANFLMPALSLSSNYLHFKYFHGNGEENFMSQRLTIQNVTPLPVNILCSTQKPFNVIIKGDSTLLYPYETKVAQVTFDPFHHNDRSSGDISSSVDIRFLEHPAKISVDVRASQRFPNIAVSTEEINLGHANLLEMKQSSLTIKNIASSLPVNFDWKIDRNLRQLDNDFSLYAPDSFEIVPRNGVLEPGEEIVAKLKFKADRPGLFFANFVCKVEGGPIYHLKAKSICANVSYKLETDVITLEDMKFYQMVEKVFWIQNTGEGPFDIKLITRSLPFIKQRLSVTVNQQSLHPGEKGTVAVRYCPCFPGQIDDYFFLSLGNEEPVKISIKGRADAPDLDISELPNSLVLAQPTVTTLDYELKLMESISSVIADYESHGKVHWDEWDKIKDSMKLKFIIAGKSAEKNVLVCPIFPNSMVVVARYVCDFGSVNRVQLKRKTFSITNVSKVPVSLDPVKSALKSSDFRIEVANGVTEGTNSLMPKETLKIVAHFKASKSYHMDNLISDSVPIHIGFGNYIMIDLKAQVVIPTLTVSHSEIIFGDVLVGQTKQCQIEVKNISDISCDWKYKPLERVANLPLKVQQNPIKTFGRNMNKNQVQKEVTEEISDEELIIEPRNGSLAAGESCIVVVKYSPKKTSNLTSGLQLIAANSSNITKVICTGTGIFPNIEASKNVLDFGQVLPYSDAIEDRFVLTNTTGFPLDVLALDLDFFKLEENEKSPENILDNVVRRISASPPSETASLPTPNQKDEPLKSASGQSSSAFNNFSQQQATIAVPDSRKQTALETIYHHMILHGPPYSGKTGLALKIADQYGYAYLKVDDLIQATSEKDGNLAERTRHYLSSWRHEKNKLETTAEESQSDLNFGSKDFDMELLTEILIGFVSEKNKARFKYFVIDGLDSVYVKSPINILKTLVQALDTNAFGKTKSVLIHIQVDAQQIQTREAASLASAQDDLHLFSSDVEDDVPTTPTDHELGILDSQMFAYRKAIRKQKVTHQFLAHNHHLQHSHQSGHLTTGNSFKKYEDTRRNGKHFSSHGKGSRTLRNSSKTKLVAATIDRSESKVDWEEGAETSSNPLLNIFDHENTMKTYESYVSGVEPLINFIKDGCKNDGKAPVVDKKTNNTKPGADKKPAAGTLEKQNSGDLEHESPVLLMEMPMNESVDQCLKRILNAVKINLGSIFNLYDVDSHQGRNVDDGSKKPTKALEFSYDQMSVSDTILACQKETINPCMHFKVVGINPVEKTNNATKDEYSIEAGTQVQPPSTPVNTAAQISNQNNSAKQIKSVKKSEQHIENGAQIQHTSRFTILPGESYEMVVRFTPSWPQNIDEEIKLAVLGTGQFHTFKCKAVCKPPSLNKENFIVFKDCISDNDSQLNGSSSNRVFLVNKNVFDFGCLVINKQKDHKSSDRHRATFHLKYDAKSGSPVRITIAMKQDQKGDCFVLESPSTGQIMQNNIMTVNIEPNSAFDLSVWALPRNLGILDDTIIVTVQQNPEPFLINVSCTGTKLDLELDKKQLNFDKIPIGFTEMKEVSLRNPSLLPIYWKISLLETLGEEFLLTPTEGVIFPGEKTTIQGTFKGSNNKAFAYKKTLKIDVSEADRPHISNLEIPFQIYAESFEVLVDVGLPKGVDVLDFGILRVGEEVKQIITLKNRSKYDVGYKIACEKDEFEEIFDVTPNCGTLNPSEKALNIQVSLNSHDERSYTQPVEAMQIYVYEVNSEKIIHKLPLFIMANIQKSRFVVNPSKLMNFGVCALGTKVSKQLIVENHGVFDLKFIVSRLNSATQNGITAITSDSFQSLKKKRMSKGSVNSNNPGAPGILGGNMNLGNVATLTEKSKRDIGKQQDSICLGPFTISPSSGLVGQNSKFILNVDFHSDVEACFIEHLAIELLDKDATETGEYVAYQLRGEIELPSIQTAEWNQIFDDSIWMTLDQYVAPWATYPVFNMTDKVLSFGPTCLGKESMFTLNLINPKKIPCDVHLSVKPKFRTDENPFDIQPRLLHLGPRETLKATVSFTSNILQSFIGILEATVDTNVSGKEKTLKFDVSAETTLPLFDVQVNTIQTPYVSSGDSASEDELVLKFPSTTKNGRTTRSFVVVNSGSIPIQLQYEWEGPNPSFKLDGHQDNEKLKPGSKKIIQVHFQPNQLESHQNELRLSVADNSFEYKLFKFVGFCSQSPVVLHWQNSQEGGLLGEEINDLQFGDLAIGQTKIIQCRLVHRPSISSEPLKGTWIVTSPFSVFPQSFILGAGESKEIQITCYMDKPGKVKSSLKLALYDSRDNMLSDVDITIPLEVSADYASYKFDIEEMQLPETFVGERSNKVMSLVNNGNVDLTYEAKLFDANGTMVHGPFEITPPTNVIPAHKSQDIKVNFNPKQLVEYNNYTLVMLIPQRKPDQLPTCIRLSGKVRSKTFEFEWESGSNMNQIHSTSGEVIFSKEELLPLISNKEVLILRNLGSDPLEFKVSSTSDEVILSKNVVTVHRSEPIEIFFKLYEAVPSMKEYVIFLESCALGIKEKVVVNKVLRKPRVHVDRVYLPFKMTKISKKRTEPVKLINGESFPIKYKISRQNVPTEGNSDLFTIDQTAGVILPKSDQMINITYSPKLPTVSQDCFIITFEDFQGLEYVFTVLGRAFDLNDVLRFTGEEGSEAPVNQTMVPSQKKMNTLALGKIYSQQEKAYRFKLQNQDADYPLDCEWQNIPLSYLVQQLPQPANLALSIHPNKATIPPGQTQEFIVLAKATKIVMSAKSKASSTVMGQIACVVSGEKVYNIIFEGNFTKPLLKLELPKLDFGSLFVLPKHMMASLEASSKKCIQSESTVILRNAEQISYRLTCTIVDSSGAFSFKNGDYVQNILPRGNLAIPLTFRPKDKGVVKAKLVVKLPEHDAEYICSLQGTGVEPTLALVDKSKNVQFGHVKIASTMKRTLKFKNQSSLPLSLSIGTAEGTTSLDLQQQQRLQSIGLKVEPLGKVQVPVNASLMLDITYAPKQKIASWQEKIAIRLDLPNFNVPILLEECFVSANATGPQIKLKESSISFGRTQFKTTVTKWIEMENLGDVEAKFKWDMYRSNPAFQIHPAEGVIAPNGVLNLKATFTPRQNINNQLNNVGNNALITTTNANGASQGIVNSNSNTNGPNNSTTANTNNPSTQAAIYNNSSSNTTNIPTYDETIVCYVDGVRCCTLSLNGGLLTKPTMMESIRFSTAIRTTETKAFPIINKHHQPGVVKIHLDQSASNQKIFSCDTKDLHLESGQTKNVILSYRPSQMSAGAASSVTSNQINNPAQDEAQLCIEYPDGAYEFYKLVGTGERPLVTESVIKDLICRKQHHETIQVSNWLPVQQKLKLAIEIAKLDMLISIKLPTDELNLTPLGTSELVLTLVPYKEGMYNARLVLKNESTGDYIWYQLSYRVQPNNEEGEPITMSTFVREKYVHSLSVYNPLDTSFTMPIACAHADITVQSPILLAPQSVTVVPIEYFPTNNGESSTKLITTSSELGSITYDVRLIAKPAKPEKPLIFSTHLGASHVQTVKWTNYSKGKVEYTCKLDSTEFFCERTVMSASSSTPNELALELTFEPTKVCTDYQARLIISSAVSGEYIYPFIATCLPAKAQGPLSIRVTAPYTLVFKNIYQNQGNFTYTVDSNEFTVKGPETIAAKKTGQVIITYKGSILPTTTAGPQTTTVFSNQSIQSLTAKKHLATGKLIIAHAQSGTQWIYYLKGFQN